MVGLGLDIDNIHVSINKDISHYNNYVINFNAAI